MKTYCGIKDKRTVLVKEIMCPECGRTILDEDFEETHLGMIKFEMKKFLKKIKDMNNEEFKELYKRLTEDDKNEQF